MEDDSYGILISPVKPTLPAALLVTPQPARHPYSIFSPPQLQQSIVAREHILDSSLMITHASLIQPHTDLCTRRYDFVGFKFIYIIIAKRRPVDLDKPARILSILEHMMRTGSFANKRPLYCFRCLHW